MSIHSRNISGQIPVESTSAGPSLSRIIYLKGAAIFLKCHVGFGTINAHPQGKPCTHRTSLRAKLNAVGFRCSLVQSVHSRFLCASGMSPIPVLHSSGYGGLPDKSSYQASLPVTAFTGEWFPVPTNPSHTNRRIKTNDFETSAERWKARQLFTAT